APARRGAWPRTVASVTRTAGSRAARRRTTASSQRPSGMYHRVLQALRGLVHRCRIRAETRRHATWEALDHVTARVAGGLVTRLLDRPEHRLGGGRAGQVAARARLAEGRRRLTQRLANREGQHERRLPDRL